MDTSPTEPLAERPQLSRLGARLRVERQRKDMSIREIAGRIGVSASLISQIERDEVNPSVSTLWGLVTVLELSMSELFPDLEQPPESRAESPPGVQGQTVELMTSPDSRPVINLESGVRWERLTAGRDPLVEFLTIVYPPGSSSCDEDSLVRHGGKEYGLVLRGVLGVRIGFDEYRLGPRMAISFDSSSPHRLWTIGDQPVEAIWVVVGRQSDGREPHL